MKLSERIRCFAKVTLTQKQCDKWADEAEQLEDAVQAAIDFCEDGPTSKELYDAYLRFVEAVQPFLTKEPA